MYICMSALWTKPILTMQSAMPMIITAQHYMGNKEVWWKSGKVNKLTYQARMCKACHEIAIISWSTYSYSVLYMWYSIININTDMLAYLVLWLGVCHRPHIVMTHRGYELSLASAREPWLFISDSTCLYFSSCSLKIKPLYDFPGGCLFL